MPQIYKLMTAIIGGLVLAGCQTATTQPQPASVQATATQAAPSLSSDRFTRIDSQAQRAPQPPADLWQLTRQHLALEPRIDHPRVDDQLAWFLDHDAYMRHASQQAVYYYHYVLNRVLERELPAELALLPFVESSYDPFAESPSRASGAWQFIPSTADLFGLKSNWWYDGRRDIIESTEAALDFLQYLNERFDGDWLLALAAYNCGEGCVSRAIKRNAAAGKPTDYWHLKLPRETRRYVPKLIAIARLIDRADELNVDLAELPNEPYFEIVSIEGQIELAKAARLAGVDLKLLKRLNPGFSRWATDPAGPHRLLLPRDTSERFRTAMSELPASERVTWTRYVIRPGDTLSEIAARFDTRVSVLRQSNKLASNRIRAGKTLLIPAPWGAGEASRLAAREGSSGKRVHRVSRGDNLWNIARRYGVSTEQLVKWNGIRDARALRPGQDLILYPESSADPG
jgi:membrane-bound lytic murein transglycosylase D